MRRDSHPRRKKITSRAGNWQTAALLIIAERVGKSVERYVREQQIPYAVVTDNDFATWTRYDNHAWPAWYLIDKHGIVRHVHVGEGEYAETEREIEALLAEE